jgi:hypothetical protein
MQLIAPEGEMEPQINAVQTCTIRHPSSNVERAFERPRRIRPALNMCSGSHSVIERVTESEPVRSALFPVVHEKALIGPRTIPGRKIAVRAMLPDHFTPIRSSLEPTKQRVVLAAVVMLTHVWARASHPPQQVAQGTVPAILQRKLCEKIDDC